MNIIVSPYLPPDFYAVTYPRKPWKMWGKYTKKSLRRYARKLMLTAKPECHTAYYMNGQMIVSPEMNKLLKEQFQNDKPN